MHFKSVLAIVALVSYSTAVMAAPVQRRSYVVDLDERNYEEDLQARFDELMIEDLLARADSYDGSGELRQRYKHSLEHEPAPDLRRDLGGHALEKW